MKALITKYKKLSNAERKQVITLIFASFFAAYLFAAQYLWREMFEAEKMADRRANRIELRIGDFKPPEINPNHSEENLREVQKELLVREQRLISIYNHMMPLNQPEPRERTKFEISRLGNRTEVEIVELKTIGDKIRPLPAEMSKGGLREQFAKRPSFNITAYGGYYDLINFFDGLNSLPYYNLVSSVSIVPTDNPDDSRLKINFNLQL